MIKHLFLYYETFGEDLIPDKLFENLTPCLREWPGDPPRRWVELIDVFHFNAPESVGHWKRKSPVENHIGKIGRLKT